MPRALVRKGKLTFSLTQREVTPMAQHTYRAEVARSGITFGTALAIAISWSLNQSLLWAILHGIFSWFYVIYFALTR